MFTHSDSRPGRLHADGAWRRPRRNRLGNLGRGIIAILCLIFGGVAMGAGFGTPWMALGGLLCPIGGALLGPIAARADKWDSR